MPLKTDKNKKIGPNTNDQAMNELLISCFDVDYVEDFIKKLESGKKLLIK